jgi:hypothetical protein
MILFSPNQVSVSAVPSYDFTVLYSSGSVTVWALGYASGRAPQWHFGTFWRLQLAVHSSEVYLYAVEDLFIFRLQ